MNEPFFERHLGLSVIMITVLVSLCIAIPAVLIDNYTQHRYCTQVANYGTVSTEWKGWVDGCYVTEDGKTFPIDKWRAVPQ